MACVFFCPFRSIYSCSSKEDWVGDLGSNSFPSNHGTSLLSRLSTLYFSFPLPNAAQFGVSDTPFQGESAS